MVFDIIPLIILFAMLAIIGIIVWRRWPYVAQIQVEEIPEHQQSQVKHALLEGRLRRRLQEVAGWIIKQMPVLHLTQARERVRHTWQNLVHREEAWRLKVFRRSHPLAQAEQVEAGLKDVVKLIDEQAWVEAEKKLLLLIRLAPRQLDSYRYLAQVYEQQKNWRDAAETFLYIISQESPREEDYLYLGELYRQAGDHRRALGMFKKAFELDPRDPKNLDFLCEESILEGNLQLAEQALKILQEVNPENQKIRVFAERLKELKK